MLRNIWIIGAPWFSGFQLDLPIAIAQSFQPPAGGVTSTLFSCSNDTGMGSLSFRFLRRVTTVRPTSAFPRLKPIDPSRHAILRNNVYDKITFFPPYTTLISTYGARACVLTIADILGGNMHNGKIGCSTDCTEPICLFHRLFIFSIPKVSDD